MSESFCFIYNHYFFFFVNTSTNTTASAIAATAINTPIPSKPVAGDTSITALSSLMSINFLLKTKRQRL